MTENRCIELLKKMKHMFTETCAKIDENTALDMAVEAIEEIQQYRAIGTVEGYENVIKAYEETYNLMKKYKSKLQEYEAIGAIEELQDLKSRLRSYKDQMSIYAEQHKVILASDVLEALEELEW